MGFGGIWRVLIKNCLSFTKFSMLINGSSFGFFESEIGLHQGDPRSFSFSLCVGEPDSKQYVLESPRSGMDQRLLSGKWRSNGQSLTVYG